MENKSSDILNTLAKSQTNILFESTNTEGANYATIKPKTVTGAFKSELSKIISEMTRSIAPTKQEQINDLFDNLDLGATFDIDATKITENDAMFFVNMLNQNGLINYSVQDGNIEITTKNDNPIAASKTLLNMLQTSIDTKKPVRLDFDNDITVILKLDDKGKVNAHFIPGDKAAEEYLRNNIPFLKQRFDEQNIQYNQISYKQQQRQENPKDENKKESKQ